MPGRADRVSHKRFAVSFIFSRKQTLPQTNAVKTSCSAYPLPGWGGRLDGLKTIRPLWQHCLWARWLFWLGGFPLWAARDLRKLWAANDPFL